MDQTWVSEYVIPLILNCSPLFKACDKNQQKNLISIILLPRYVQTFNCFINIICFMKTP